jgi:hypothetical protein
MIFLLLNNSIRVPVEAFQAMISALILQAHDFADAWEMLPPRIVASLDELTPNERADHLTICTVTIEDSAPDAQDELGDHSIDEDGNPQARILVDVSMAAAGSTDPKIAVCPVLSHEILEAMGDLYANKWANDSIGAMWALEVCDPVQGDTYLEDGCSLSNYVLPGWFDSLARIRGNATNRMGTPIAPFEIAPNGYAIRINEVGDAEPVFGEKVTPERKIKALRGRLGRRMTATALIKHLEHARRELGEKIAAKASA